MFQASNGITGFTFSRNLATKDLFPAASQESLGARLTCLVRECGCGLVISEIGFSKSTAVRAFADSLDFNHYLVVYMADPTTGMTGLSRDLLLSLGYEPPFSKPRLLARIRTALENRPVNKHRARVVILDGAYLLT
jgi:type II secretory pathway predicted ATPase ExeA